MKALFVIGVIIIGLIILVCLLTTGKTVGKLDNRWCWAPATGPVGHYEVWKLTPADDNFVLLAENVPPDTQIIDDVECVVFEYVSPHDEAYQLRIRAVDAEGHKSNWSVVSGELNVDVNSSRAGKPVVVED